MNENNSKNHQRSILEQNPKTQLMLERYKCYEIPELLDSLDQKLKILEMMNGLNALMIWRDEFNANINVLNEKATAAFHKEYSSLQATVKSPSIHSQKINQSRESKKASGLRISEIIDLTLDSNEGRVDIGVGNASEKPSNSVDYSIPHDVAQSTTTTAPPQSNQMYNNSPSNQDMGEKQVFNGSRMIDPELAFRYAENEMDFSDSDFRAPLDTQPSYSAPQEMSPQPMSNSETVPGSTAARRRGDPHSCNVCSKTFTRGTTLREHERSHTNERPCICSTCRKGFSRRKDCRRHELLHANAKKFYCAGHNPPRVFKTAEDKDSACGRSFTRMDALKAHWNSLRGSECLKVLFELEKEKRLYSIEQGLFDDTKCVCGDEFESVDGLKTHLEVPFQSSCLRQSVMDSGEFHVMNDYKYRQRTK
ncbi:putative transcriptional regulator prz1 protein [Botrytis fragariae]|uniref:Putative transcriptional regulator prz1 protein n=1 Tax=Botrytis fragariae TaxID=1964551 RepID=A0A8H6EF27_9HELO|nr:putative transcriptional regulator prz1 protein [Botrytis fragariae]KAF5869897.1 putative transcriptional regulator prz1 protein [Botrytis fragariae]